MHLKNMQPPNPTSSFHKVDTLIEYMNMGFKPVPLDELSQSPTLTWSEIYANPEFWSEEKIKDSVYKFHNVATTFGKTKIKDIDGSDLYLHCLDIDSPEVLRRVQHLLEQEWKFKTFVTKTQKDCGYHIYWFEHHGYNIQIVTDQCKKGYEFEIKCGKALCTLPGSRHRDNPLFHYECIGQPNKIMLSDGLYENLINALLKDCLRPMKNITRGSNRICTSKSCQTTLPITENNTKAEQEKSRDIFSRIISLSEEKIKESIEYLVPYYQQRTRHKFAFGFSGLAFKEGVSENSAAQILQGVCDKANDYEEKDDRLNTLRRTYGKGVEIGHDAITGKSTLKEVMTHVSNCDEIAAESKVQDLLRIWHEDCSKPEVNDDKVTPSLQAGKDESTSLNISAKELLKSELLAARIHNPTEYAISIISKTVKCDDSLVRGIFYAGCSAWSYDPMNLVISAPTSEGKTYTVLETLQYFPTKDVRKIGSMSPKVIVRQDSTLVDADTLEPIQYKIDDLKSQIKSESNEKLKLRLQNEIDNLNQSYIYILTEDS